MSEQQAIQHLATMYQFINLGSWGLWIFLTLGLVGSIFGVTHLHKKDCDIFLISSIPALFFVALTVFAFYHSELKTWALASVNQQALENVLEDKERISVPVTQLKHLASGYSFSTKDGSYAVTKDFAIVHDIPQQFSYFYSYKGITQDLSPMLKKGHFEEILHLHNLDDLPKQK